MAASPAENRLVRRPKISPVCNNCRDRHLKCSGGIVCERCTKDGVSCLFRPSRRGLQGTPVIRPKEILPKPTQASAGTCSACRERHVKCSGVDPCSWCVRKGLPCTFRESRRGQGKQVAQSTQDGFVQYIFSVLGTSRPLLQMEHFTDTTARRSYMYFREKTTIEFTSCHDDSFWRTLVLQVGHAQPAIKHLIIALGSLHESLELAYSSQRHEDVEHDDVRQLRLYALREQNAGITRLKHSSALSYPNVIISSILLMCFDALQRDFSSMVNTLRVTFNVLTNLQGASRAEETLLTEHTIPAFTACCKQAATFVEYFQPQRTPIDNLSRSISNSPAQAFEVPSNFLDLAHASNFLESIMEQGTALPDPVVCKPDYPSASKGLEHCQALLKQWHAALDASDLLATYTQDDHQRRLIILRIKYHMAFITTAPALDQGELRYDSYLSNFQSILTLASSWLNLTLHTSPKPKPSECRCESICDTNIVQGLMLSATHCRDPQLRRSAVHLLECNDLWQEPMWVRDGAAEIAHRIIALEEEGLPNPQSCSDVPQKHRIRLLRVSRPVSLLQKGSTAASPDLLYKDRPRQLVLHYVKAPCDVTGMLEEDLLDLTQVQMSWPSCLMGTFARGRTTVFDKSLRLNPHPCCFQRIAMTWSYSMHTAAL